MSSKKSHLFIFSLALFIVFLLVIIKFSENKALFQNPRNTKDTHLTFIPVYESDPILGNKKAPITITAFEDFLCTECRTQQVYLKELLETYEKDIRIIWKDLPLTRIPVSSQPHHIYGYCVNKQGRFSEYQDLIFTSYISKETGLDAIIEQIGIKQRKFDACLDSQEAFEHLEKTKTIAEILNIQSTPVFFINDIQINTPQSYDAWKTILGL